MPTSENEYTWVPLPEVIMRTTQMEKNEDGQTNTTDVRMTYVGLLRLMTMVDRSAQERLRESYVEEKSSSLSPAQVERRISSMACTIEGLRKQLREFRGWSR